MKLVLLRHGESEWNRSNLFSGWTDVELTDTGREEAIEAGRLLLEAGFDFDLCYASYLKRSIHTLNLALEQLDREWLPVIKSWKLNERHYGALQGFNKAETARRYGEAQVKEWRRSFGVRPPLLAPDDPRNPARQSQYREVPPELLPLRESLKDTIDRAVPYFESEIKPQIEAGKRVLVVCHGNTLRGFAMYLEHLGEQEIIDLNIPTGTPLIYEFDEEFKVLDRYYLGDAEKAAQKAKIMADQGKIQ